MAESEEEPFWQEFLRSLVKRGLHGVELVTSDAHVRLKAVAAKGLEGATRQRCRVHFMGNLLAHIPKEREVDGGDSLRDDVRSAGSGAGGRPGKGGGTGPRAALAEGSGTPTARGR